ncbi:MAG: Asp-tRNA(Asn)/Glu-tRNA(Gln) amidotransferase subunit GatA, partial [Deltaproteobacteria bacterium]|nr:Asp-tRNA(Asn)/Glu-tRNA(Gln) amidotransferase subunit GatA [Deltaproteobacteria bacterium]
MELCRLTIHEAHDLLIKGEISSVELTSAVFDRIEQVEDRIGAYITLVKDRAMAEAEAADEMIRQGKGGPLTGIPLAIKDLLCTEGIKTTCGSKILENFIPPYSSTVVNKLKDARAVIVGKTNMDEFGMGSSTEHSAFMVTRNPWDLTRIPGGSSGGSAAAVAADECIAAIGTDTGGSIRHAILMNTICGYDPNDSTSVPREVPDYTKVLQAGLKGFVVGIPTEYFAGGLDEDVAQAVHAAIKVIEGLGATCKPVSLPHTEYAVAVYYLIAPAE